MRCGRARLSATKADPDPKALLPLGGSGGEVWELNFYFSGLVTCWYFPMVCQAPCYLQDQIRFFLFVHIDLLYQKAQGKILKTVSFKLVLLAAQIIRERRKGIESLVLRQLSSPSIKSSSVSESELF